MHMQRKQIMLVSVTLSRYNLDIDPEFHPAVFEMLRRYVTGIFGAGRDDLFVSVALERGKGQGNLHIQAAAAVRPLGNLNSGTEFDTKRPAFAISSAGEL